MRNLLVIATLLFFIFSANAQDYPDSGFTNKAEATNSWVNGLKEGKWVEGWEVDANPISDVFDYELTIYKAGQPNGIQRQYYKNGNIFGCVPYKNGLRAGVVKYYYENGQIESEGLCVNDLETGSWKKYYKNGKLMREILWEKGKSKKKTYYDESGNVIINGEIREIYGTGCSCMTIIKKGKFKTMHCYDSNGKIFREPHYFLGMRLY